VRLKKVETGHRLGKKLMLGMIRLFMGEAPDVVRMLMYRPELLGNRLNAVTQAAMRGESEWSVGERELFAAFVSRQNQCPF
jgi:hypothetical protein